MLPVLRILSPGGTLTVAAIVAGTSSPAARAQVFDYAITDPGGNGALGSAVARAGDIDGDGYEDFIVGEPNATVNGAAGTGLFRIESGWDGAEILESASQNGSNYGAAVAGRIDYDGDGYFEVLIGGPLNDGTGTNQSGLVAVWSQHQYAYLDFWNGPVAFGHFGSSVRSLEGDVDGDGLDDFIVGAPGNDASYVITSGSGVVLFTNNGQSGAGFGTSVCRGGDLDNDGIVDYLVGSPDYVDSGGTRTGRVTAFAGKDGSKLWTVDGAADSKFGKSLAQPGDLDGDGQGDIVVGAPQHLDSSGNKTGCAIVLSGANHSAIYKVFGDVSGDTFGHDVHRAGGDLDNDGTSDFIVGAPQLLGSDVGYARTISGASGSVLFTYTEHTSDPKSKSNYGSAVAGGDWNGDGRTDVVIGGAGFNGGDGIAETWITAVASWSNYDAGWPGTHGVPGFAALSNPVVGRKLTLVLDDSAGVATSALLMIGVSKASIPTGKGGTLLVPPLLVMPLTLPAGGLTLSGQVPDDPSLYGFDLYLQALEVDAGASKGISFTPGLDLFFGFD